MKSFLLAAALPLLISCSNSNSTPSQTPSSSTDSSGKPQAVTQSPATLDTALYDRLQTHLANGDSSGRWPVKSEYPLPGALLPFNRIVAYYGNLYSVKMGALGKWPKDTMIPKLKAEVAKWNEADSVLKSIPALHYICVTAQGSPGKDSKWRFRMPHSQIDTIIKWANEINAVVFLDMQVGLSDVQAELPLLEKYMAMPNVHFGVDPEFAMKAKGNKKPGSVIGSLDASDLNFVGDYLADIVKKNNLPPKIFMVHRFTQGMVTNAKNIRLHPEIQFVMDMDGWGPTAKKKSTYDSWIVREPVQFTGFKLFYVNDTEYSNQAEMMSREEILKLKPVPVYIQYQ